MKKTLFEICRWVVVLSGVGLIIQFAFDRDIFGMFLMFICFSFWLAVTILTEKKTKDIE